ncbi:MAG: hypothetical protein HWD60_19280 [Defluviicoccus sp.]|nr:MAG: hypothetical protein HWD60_19280 [Defluviicoccus sp.]
MSNARRGRRRAAIPALMAATVALALAGCEQGAVAQASVQSAVLPSAQGPDGRSSATARLRC